MNHRPVLYYFHDPMCSWCWGFKPVLNKLIKNISDIVEIEYILGGLAKDSEATMSVDMQSQIENTWRRIQQTIPGTQFNFDFWKNCTPRRSTYPACRAVIAARQQDTINDVKMISAIQKAYYTQSLNPSDYPVLYHLAQNLELDTKQFKDDIHAVKTQYELEQQIAFANSVGANSFPSLFLHYQQQYYPIVLDYNNVDIIVEHIKSYLS